MEPGSEDRGTTSVVPGAGRTRRFFGVLGACLAAALVAGGCTDTAADENPSGPLTATTPDEAESTPAEASPADEAKAALEAYLEFRDETYRTGQIDYERLDQIVTGAEHLRIQESVTVYIVAEYKISGEWAYEVALDESLTEDATRVARFDVCEDRSGVEFVKPDGTVTDILGPDGNPLPNPWAWTYTVERDPDHGWRVSEAAPVTGPSEPHELGEYESC